MNPTSVYVLKKLQTVKAQTVFTYKCSVFEVGTKASNDRQSQQLLMASYIQFFILVRLKKKDRN